MAKASDLIKKVLRTVNHNKADIAEGFFILLLLRIIALVPLVALLTDYKWIAVLTPGLFLFFVLPLRYSAADAYMHFVNGGRFSTVGLVSFEKYSEKLVYTLKLLLHALIFAIPLFLAIGYGLYLFGGGTDFGSLLTMIQRLGFGSIELGILFVLLIPLVLLIPVFLYFSLHSVDRLLIASNRPIIKGIYKQSFSISCLSFCFLLPSIIFFAAVVPIAIIPFIKSMFREVSHISFTMWLILLGIGIYTFTLPLRKLLLPLWLQTYKGIVTDEKA